MDESRRKKTNPKRVLNQKPLGREAFVLPLRCNRGSSGDLDNHLSYPLLMESEGRFFFAPKKLEIFFFMVESGKGKGMVKAEAEAGQQGL